MDGASSVVAAANGAGGGGSKGKAVGVKGKTEDAVAAAAEDLYLYKVLERESIGREEARKLWKEGRVTGLFNLPTEELFEACKDFGIKVKACEYTNELQQLQQENEKLKQRLKLRIQQDVEKQRVLEEVKQALSSAAERQLLQEEEQESRAKDWAQTKKTLLAEQRKLRKEKKTLEEANQRLLREEQRWKEQQLQMQKEIAELQKQMDDIRAEQKQILQAERKFQEQLAQENKHLRSLVDKAHKENEELKLTQHISQTDHLNRKLLESFMINMDSIEHAWDENDEDEWKDDEEGET
ncbi:hypothetical protein QOT17_019079 [Balamuthia mandrillaris]